MATFFILSILVSSFIAYHKGLIVEAHHHHHPLVPAIYAFGDSGVDNGNNNYLLNAFAKANKWPYGVDNPKLLGRFSNGKNAVDFFAEYLGLQLPRPYLSLSELVKSRTKISINYASGGCGILNTTRAGDCLSLEKQVEYFTSTSTIDLPKAFKSSKKLKHHLAKSIYLLLIGSNDYAPQVNQGMLTTYGPERFAECLVGNMTKQIQKLYNLGGRKFLVSSLASCNAHNYTSGCETMYYADKLSTRLQELQSNLHGSLFSIYNGVNLMKEVQASPEHFGFKYLNTSCSMNGQLCANRSEYIKFDHLGHPTEAFYHLTAKDCFNGTSCIPNLLSLAKA